MSEAVILDSYERELPIHLSDEEVAERAQRAADKQAEIGRLTDERESHMKELAGQIKSAEGARNELLRQVRLRQDLDFVGVEKRLLPKERAVQVVRLDTGEVIDERAAREDEMQIHLLPGSKPKRDGDGDDDQQAASGE
jgi:hypothetical protein